MTDQRLPTRRGNSKSSSDNDTPRTTATATTRARATTNSQVSHHSCNTNTTNNDSHHHYHHLHHGSNTNNSSNSNKNSSKAQEATGKAMASMADALLEFFIWELAIEVHRRHKKGLICICPSDPLLPHTHNNGLVLSPGLDVFGNGVPKDGGPNVTCPSCKMMRHSAKFAPHLEKCMGIGGRESRRVALSRTKAQISGGQQRRSGTNSGDDRGTAKRPKRWG